MNILVIGSAENLAECESKFGSRHNYTYADDHREAEKLVSSHNLVLDFIIDEEPFEIEIYRDKTVQVFLNTVKISLAEVLFPIRATLKGKFFGFNGLPTFVNTPVLELSVYNSGDGQDLADLCRELHTEYQVVDDRVGLATPRILCMIINEAYHTVQENTASRADVDLAMKQGTNYPYGPFEWCERIGVRHVYETLQALYEDTRDERYRISPLLKKEYLHARKQV